MRRCVRLRPRSVALPRRHPRGGFTLVELLVVILVILVVSVLALGIYNGTGGRQVDAAASLVQASLAGARDRAIRTGRPAGVRLLPDAAVSQFITDPNDPRFGRPDPAGILAANRIVPIEAAPNYSDGNILAPQKPPSAYTAAIRTVNGYADVPCLVLEQAVMDPSVPIPNPPTNWFWNIRIGDRIQLNNSGPEYTIVGPMTVANPEQFVNVGPPGRPAPVLSQGVPAEFLLLTNGRDDNANGWVDEGWDGVDNDGDGLVDEADEWENEQWLGAAGR